MLIDYHVSLSKLRLKEYFDKKVIPYLLEDVHRSTSVFCAAVGGPLKGAIVMILCEERKCIDQQVDNMHNS